ncbi:hypothetical protein [Pedobacter sp. KBW06]|uniref:hypothetical protein n=1 Tax=Pedobacter sp. KBW06 TaxID=2153359 RepID=UPI000F5AA147|nr:hypothetical protein [Pedobacter sp. KBW06]
MRKLILMSSMILSCLALNASVSLPVKPMNVNVPRKTLGAAEVYLNNRSTTAGATITLTSTTGAPTQVFYLNAGQTITTGLIPDGTYNITISSYGGSGLKVWRCDTDLIGGNGAATPYTFNGYNTTSSGKLIVLVF